MLKLLKDTVAEWQEDKVSLWAAALAYYTIFSIAPLLIIAISIAGAVFGEEAARGEIVGQIRGLVGQQGAEAIQTMIENANRPSSGGFIATLLGIGTLLFGASGVFTQLQDALNAIWEVKPKPGQGIKGVVKSRFLSFAMVLVIGFLLLVSLVMTAALSALSNFFSHLLPGADGLWHVVNLGIAFGVITLLFAMIYKFLPDAKIPWSDLWVGAAATAFLFTIGKFLIGLYLGHSSIGSTYGAAGSLVVVLVWIFYSAQIILFGAEFTQVYAKTHGSRIVPTKSAVLVGGGPDEQEPMPRSSHSTRTEQVNRSEAVVRRKPNYMGYATMVAGSVLTVLGTIRNARITKGRKKNRRR